MKRRRHYTFQVVMGLALLALCIAAYMALRAFLSQRESAPAPSVSGVAQFEATRRADSLRQVQRDDSLHAAWDTERAQRQQRHAQWEARQRAYADSQRVWSARRAQREAARAERQRAYADSQRVWAARKAKRDSLRAARRLAAATPWSTTRKDTIPRIAVNRADYATLVRHPYINAKQARAIIGVRNGGPIRSWNDLRGCAQFSPADIRRLTPYVDF